MTGKLAYILLFVVAGAFAEVVSDSEADIEPQVIDTGRYFRKGPSCNVQGTSASCCANININIKKIHINGNPCVVLAVDPNRLSVTGTLKWNDKVIVSQDIASAKKLCVPLPPPASLVQGCLEIYHIAVNAQAKAVEVCPGVSMNGMAGVKFGCLKFDNGRFSASGKPRPFFKPSFSGLIKPLFPGRK